ncbi:hypothetical protein EJ02DRAFT_455643 [Clathrospora elynae]|uniref:GPI anchored cell wall protein n=1 Tax=Clathrospora elynae TaxID=706981 RepID=A0A6A5SLY9_9PLEO|nr:hypothetical protein EJ02DRAFT_455643 [Clathrospora elynae]
MLGRTVFAATLFALAQFAVASPPGCLLGAVNQYADPVDVKSVCMEKDLSSKVASFCGNDAEKAMEALADICNDAGVKDLATDVSSASATKSGSSTKPTGTSGSTLVAYSTGSSGNMTAPTATGGPKPSGGAGATGTSTGGIPESTGAAGRMEIGFAAIVAGLMVIVL